MNSWFDIAMNRELLQLLYLCLVLEKILIEKVLLMANKYNGKLCHIKTSEEPNLYCIGTLNLNSSYDPLNSKGQLVIECMDGDSYRYHQNLLK